MAPKKNYSRYFIILQEEEKGYARDNGKTPSGYVKLEKKNGKCKVSYYIQNLSEKMQPYHMVLICARKDTKKVVNLGKVIIDNYGRVEQSNEYENDDIASTGLSMDKIAGAALVKIVDKNIISLMSGFITSDVPTGWKNFELVSGYKEQSDKEENIFEKYEETIENKKGEIVYEKPGQNIKQSEYEKIKSKNEAMIEEQVKYEINRQTESKYVRKDVVEYENNKKNESDEESESNKEDGAISESKESEEYTENKVSNEYLTENEVRNGNKNETKEEIEKEYEIEKTEQEKIEIEKTEEEKNKEENITMRSKNDEYVNEEKIDEGNSNNIEVNYDEYKEEIENIENGDDVELDSNLNRSGEHHSSHGEYNSSQENNEHTGDAYPIGIMGDFFKTLVKGYESPHYMSDEIKRCKWYKIPVEDIETMYDMSDYDRYTVIYYPMLCYYSYIRRYEHYCVGYKCDKDGKLKHLVYAIPGTKSKSDQPYGGKTGFVTWIPCKDNKDIGYWIMFYDIKDSTVVIPVKKK
ncbi:hypothetical protein CLTEP_19240 [Clostridium tepidiprofundi DSM 19306]|uniref:Transmembrane protein n=1 Tax=Clostridium tepidiprofundi DSM 19306 TaxID=1121338 RepID=A0A151B3C0_9CLOT|nr:hypothetical protein [Clostridium tepidiprofundi]KYH34147.1 hypothetical protein CLTEP_19240 [Clostridium tepidiprofundi DSM 19306]